MPEEMSLRLDKIDEQLRELKTGIRSLPTQATLTRQGAFQAKQIEKVASQVRDTRATLADLIATLSTLHPDLVQKLAQARRKLKTAEQLALPSAKKAR